MKPGPVCIAIALAVAAGDHARADTVAHTACEPTIHYLPKGDGTTVELHTCKPNAPHKPHPYESYSSAALEALAYSDATAAEYLGMRLRERDEAAAMRYLIRAVALAGGDATPLVHYMRSYLRPDAINGEPVKQTVRVKYVLSAVTQLLGDDRHVLPHYAAIIRRRSTDPGREIAMLDARARQIIGEMRRIELEVRGAATIGG